MARILIVDDSPTETFRFREILTKHGFDVIEAADMIMMQLEIPMERLSGNTSNFAW